MVPLGGVGGDVGAVVVPIFHVIERDSFPGVCWNC